MMLSIELRRRPSILWDWSDAPEELQALSVNGGDEDYVMLVPMDDEGQDLVYHAPNLTERAMICDVDRFAVEWSGHRWACYIGSHA